MKLKYESLPPHPEHGLPGKGLHIRNTENRQDPRVINFLNNLTAFQLEKAQEASEKSLSLTEKLGEKIKEDIKALYNTADRLLKERGVEEPSLRPVFLMPEDPITMKSMGQKVGDSHIEIYNTDIENKDLKRLTFLITAAHELYHSSAKLSIDTRIFTEEKLFGLIKNNRFDPSVGAPDASYAVREKATPTKFAPMALTEGLAISFQDEMYEIIKTWFNPKVITRYENICAGWRERWQELAIKNPSEPIYKERPNIKHINLFQQVSNRTSDETKADFDPHGDDSQKLVEYLSSEIDDFEVIVEKARTQRRTLDLARAIEERFGAGWYRKITTTTTKEAKKVLEELRKTK